jgi:two-component system sensor histidine kinase KdpD
VTDPDRPNPDALLAAIQKEEAARQHGRLKVFLGMSPGVGKTYAMLEAARRELAAGRDVVVGYVETHRRKETDALTEGLPLIPRREIEYRGVTFTEMDLDAVLARHPQLVLVDEFAHTNAPGSRHPKRYQDVMELLAAGLDVYTTLNIQHVESRAEAVRQITTAAIRETVPDTALDHAEFELVDLTPEELRARLAAGKVYLGPAAQAAQENFFRPGNLAALRELALRFAAEQVGQDVLAYRQAAGIGDPWKSGQRLLVAVSSSPTSAALVRWTRRLAGELQAPWCAVYVELPTPLSTDQAARLKKNLALARELGAQIIHTTDAEPARGILRVAREQNTTQLVVGKPIGRGTFDWLRGGSLLSKLIRQSGNIDVHAVRAEAEAVSFRRPELPRLEAGGLQGYGVALAVVAGVTGLNALLQKQLGYQSLALVYLLSVVVLAMFVGRWPTLLAATLTALVWDYLFVPPVFTFHISETTDLMLFFTYFAVALAMGHLAARLRAEQTAERRREQRATALYLLTRELANATDFTDLLAIIVREVGKTFAASVTLSLPEDSDPGGLTRYFASTWVMTEKEEGVADWAFRRQQPAGCGTDTLPSAEGLHLPLLVTDRIGGVLSLKFAAAAELDSAQRDLLDSFVRQIALVLDRQRLRATVQEAKLLAESERLSKALLNSISHELRTPIAAIASASSGLAELVDHENPALQRALTGEIRTAAIRLNRLVGNLLDMTRLESGHMKLRLEWCDLADLTGVALRQVEKELARHPVTNNLPRDLPLVKIDFVLMEQVLVNLFLNAALYTPSGTTVQINAAIEGREIALTVADNGPGFPPEALPHLFDKFYRAPGAAAGGSGLGLSIVKGFVDAHGGTVSAQNRPGGGAEFTIRLPLNEAPPSLEAAP